MAEVELWSRWASTVETRSGGGGLTVGEKGEKPEDLKGIVVRCLCGFCVNRERDVGGFSLIFCVFLIVREIDEPECEEELHRLFWELLLLLFGVFVCGLHWFLGSVGEVFWREMK